MFFYAQNVVPLAQNREIFPGGSLGIKDVVSKFTLHALSAVHLAAVDLTSL